MKHISKLIKIIIIAAILIYAAYLVIVANYSKEIIMIRHSISASDIIFKYEMDPFRYINAEDVDFAFVPGHPIFFIYKNREKLGFIQMRLYNEPFGVRRYLLTGKYAVDIKTGKAIIMQPDRMSPRSITVHHDYDKNVNKDM